MLTVRPDCRVTKAQTYRWFADTFERRKRELLTSMTEIHA